MSLGAVDQCCPTDSQTLQSIANDFGFSPEVHVILLL